MRKILVLTIVLMLFALSVAPISAETHQPQVIMQGSGQVEFPFGSKGFANITLHVDTATGKMRMELSIPRGVMTPDGQFITGLYAVAEVTGHTIDGSTVTVDVWGETFFRPSRESLGPPSELQIVGKLTGPGNRGTISAGEAPGFQFTIPGTIIIR